MSLSRFFKRARNIDASHYQINYAGRDQYSVNLQTTIANQETVIGALKPVDRSVQGIRQWLVDNILRWLKRRASSSLMGCQVQLLPQHWCQN